MLDFPKWKVWAVWLTIDHSAERHVARLERLVHRRGQPAGDIPVDRLRQHMLATHQVNAAIGEPFTFRIQTTARRRLARDQPVASHLRAHARRPGKPQCDRALLEHFGGSTAVQEFCVEAVDRIHFWARLQNHRATCRRHPRQPAPFVRASAACAAASRAIGTR